MSKTYKERLAEFANDIQEHYKLEPKHQEIIDSIDNLSKPEQYRIGIDTFERMKANCTKDEIIGACKLNIDKYIWRKKGSDLDDLKKAKDYIDLWIWTLENK